MDFVADGQPFDSCQFLILQMIYCVFVSGKMYKAAVQLDRKNELEALLKKKKTNSGTSCDFSFFIIKPCLVSEENSHLPEDQVQVNSVPGGLLHTLRKGLQRCFF